MQYEAQQKQLSDKMKARQKDYFQDLKVQVSFFSLVLRSILKYHIGYFLMGFGTIFAGRD